MANYLLRVREDSCMSQYPVSLPHDQLVALLDRAGFRPQSARSLPGLRAWGAPVQHTAYCPACQTDGGLVVEPFGKSDPRSVLFCTNSDRCPSHTGATRERDVHLALLPAICRVVEVSA